MMLGKSFPSGTLSWFLFWIGKFLLIFFDTFVSFVRFGTDFWVVEILDVGIVVLRDATGSRYEVARHPSQRLSRRVACVSLSN